MLNVRQEVLVSRLMSAAFQYGEILTRADFVNDCLKNRERVKSIGFRFCVEDRVDGAILFPLSLLPFQIKQHEIGRSGPGTDLAHHGG